jgi:hypothetical protein
VKHDVDVVTGRVGFQFRNNLVQRCPAIALILKIGVEHQPHDLVTRETIPVTITIVFHITVHRQANHCRVVAFTVVDGENGQIFKMPLDDGVPVGGDKPFLIFVQFELDRLSPVIGAERF